MKKIGLDKLSLSKSKLEASSFIVSYLISEDGYCFKIVDKPLLTKKVLNCLSDAVLKEYTDVFNRTRFSKKYPTFNEKSNLLLESLIKFSEITNPSFAVDKIKDKTDNKFLELAYAANADFLIIGNKLHFTFASFYNTHIVSPREYWETYKP